MPYLRLLVLIVAAGLLNFAISYLNVRESGDMWFSMGRVWPAVTMGAALGIVVILVLPRIFSNWAANSAVLAAALAAIAASVWLVRSQEGSSDIGFLRNMIPHHSAAILAAERARLSDARVRELADRIRRDQATEIAIMERLIGEIGGESPPADAPQPPPAGRDKSARR